MIAFMDVERNTHRVDLLNKIQDLANTEYLDCLIIREKLYGTLKNRLYNYVKRVFHEFQRQLLSEQNQRGVPKSDQELLVACKANRRKEHLAGVDDLADFEYWDNPQVGCWVLAHNFISSIPTDGNILKIDPSSLLILINSCKLFRGSLHYNWGLAYQMKFIRDSCFAHIPELRLCDDLIPDKLQRLEKSITSVKDIIDRIQEFCDEI